MSDKCRKCMLTLLPGWKYCPICGTQVKVIYPLRQVQKLDDPITAKDWEIIFQQEMPEECKDDLHELFKRKNRPTPMRMTAREINLCLSNAKLLYRIIACGCKSSENHLTMHKLYKVELRNGH